jgi:hypothetical protein
MGVPRSTQSEGDVQSLGGFNSQNNAPLRYGGNPFRPAGPGTRGACSPRPPHLADRTTTKKVSPLHTGYGCGLSPSLRLIRSLPFGCVSCRNSSAAVCSAVVNGPVGGRRTPRKRSRRRRKRFIRGRNRSLWRRFVRVRSLEDLRRIVSRGVGWLDWPCLPGRRPRPDDIDA